MKRSDVVSLVITLVGVVFLTLDLLHITKQTIFLDVMIITCGLVGLWLSGE